MATSQQTRSCLALQQPTVMRGQHCKEESQKAEKLWEDDDFENYNNFCSQQLLEIPMTVTRIFRAWEEGLGESSVQ